MSNFVMPSSQRERTEFKQKLAQKMRRNPTAAEAVVQPFLAFGVDGYAFESQVLVLGYIADFLCRKIGCVIEIDGPCHSKYKRLIYDQTRDAAMLEVGLLTWRFSNREVLGDTLKAFRKMTEIVRFMADSRKKPFNKLSIPKSLAGHLSTEVGDHPGLSAVRLRPVKSRKTSKPRAELPVFTVEAYNKAMRDIVTNCDTPMGEVLQGITLQAHGGTRRPRKMTKRMLRRLKHIQNTERNRRNREHGHVANPPRTIAIQRIDADAAIKKHIDMTPRRIPRPHMQGL